MAFPAFLPSALMQTVQRDETALVETLQQNTPDLVTFFECACADETWSEKHPTFMSKAMQWLTMQFILERLDQKLIYRIAHAIQEHYFNLKTLLPVDIIVRIGKESIRMNSLLMAASSNLLQDRLRNECIEQNSVSLSITGLPLRVFQLFREYINTGKIEGLWKKEDDELLNLLRYSTHYDLHGLSREIATILKRYFTANNALNFLKLGLDEHLPELIAAGIEYFEQLDIGVKFPYATNEELFFEFKDFSEASLDIFDLIKDAITHLVCRGSISGQAPFRQVIQQIPRLIGLDISSSPIQPEGLELIAKRLEYLDLSRCEWLSDERFKKVIVQCPHVIKLMLRSNTQLTHRCWGDLQKIPGLLSLHLARCIQIGDEDLKLMLKAVINLKELHVDECKKLTNNAFYTLAKQIPNIVSLSLSRCHLTDSSLMEIVDKCPFLESLDIARCPNISEKSIIESIKHGHSLREINLSGCNITEETVNNLTNQYPYLVIRTERT